MATNSVLGQSLTEIRGWFDRRVEANPIGLVAHEAAHATIALALGFRVTGMTIWQDRGTWRGECVWDSAYALPDEHMIVLAAGAASVDFLHSSIASGGWWGAQEDAADMYRTMPGLTGVQKEQYRSQARTMLEGNRDTFDRLATALLRHNGEMSASQIDAIAKPGFLPSRGSDIDTWTPAQRHTLANKIEEMARSGTLPVHITRKIARRPSLAAPPTYRVGQTTIETRMGGPLEVR